jgi:hypothetical protein
MEVTLSSWANENSSNSWISGCDGELALLAQRFTGIDFEVFFSDEYGAGYCENPGFDKVYYENQTINKEIAIKFVNDPDFYEISKFASLALDAAQILASFQGDFFLGGLTKLSTDAAKALDRFFEA